MRVPMDPHTHAAYLSTSVRWRNFSDEISDWRNPRNLPATLRTTAKRHDCPKQTAAGRLLLVCFDTADKFVSFVTARQVRASRIAAAGVSH